MITKTDFLKNIGETPESWLSTLKNISYYDFKIKKSASKMRHIEAPHTQLKSIQKKLATAFNYHYKETLPSCVYGYVPALICPDGPRDIRTNALRHLTQPYMLNVDLKDFFHQIKKDTVETLCYSMGYEISLATDMSILATKDGRLPMGAPTSPVLSNWASWDMDNALMRWAAEHDIVYTRYVDDLSFSSSYDFTNKWPGIFELIKQNGFIINESKIKGYKPDATKVITGIEINDLTLNVQLETIQKIEKNIKLLKKVVHISHVANGMDKPHLLLKDEKIKAIKKSIEGQIQFVKRIEHKSSQHYKGLKKQYKMAITPDDGFEFNFYI